MNGVGTLFDLPPAAIGPSEVPHEPRAGADGPVFQAKAIETAASLVWALEQQ